MGLNRREFLGAGVVGAAQTFGATQAAQARSHRTPDKYTLLWINGNGSDRTKANDFNRDGCLTGQFQHSSSGRWSPFLFQLSRDASSGVFIQIESLLKSSARQIQLLGPAAISLDGVLAGGAVRRFRGRELPFAYRLHPPKQRGGSWRFEKGPDLEIGEEIADVRIGDAGDVVFSASDAEMSDAKKRLRVFAWLPGGTRYLDLDANGLFKNAPRPTGCCRVAGTLMVSLFGGDSARSGGCRLDYDLAAGTTEFRRLPNVDVQPGALGMNRRGEVVGSYLTRVSNGVAERAFHRACEPWTLTLGTFGGRRSAAFSINSYGDVVGHADYPGVGKAKPVVAAFLNLGCKLWDLSSLIDGLAPASLTTAQLLINDMGHIAGNVDGHYAQANSDEDAFILIPSS